MLRVKNWIINYTNLTLRWRLYLTSSVKSFRIVNTQNLIIHILNRAYEPRGKIISELEEIDITFVKLNSLNYEIKISKSVSINSLGSHFFFLLEEIFLSLRVIQDSKSISRILNRMLEKLRGITAQNNFVMPWNVYVSPLFPLPSFLSFLSSLSSLCSKF